MRESIVREDLSSGEYGLWVLGKGELGWEFTRRISSLMAGPLGLIEVARDGCGAAGVACDRGSRSGGFDLSGRTLLFSTHMRNVSDDLIMTRLGTYAARRRCILFAIGRDLVRCGLKSMVLQR